MKKLLLSLLFIAGSTQAAPWDLNAQQYDQFGTSMINRLLPLPSSGTVNAFYMYDTSINLPKLGTLDSTLGWYSGQVMGLSASKNAEIVGKFTAPTGTTAQYLRGDGSLSTFPTTVSSFSNDAGYLTGITSGQVTSALGFTPYNATNPNSYVNDAGARSAISLTTTGSGVATYSPATGVLNVPTPSGGVGTVTSITAGTGLSGGVITSSGTISLPNVGTASTYSGVTTDNQGRVTAGTNASQSSQTRTLNTIYQISATRGTLAFYSVQITATASIGSGQNGDVILEIASDSGFTTNVQTLSINGNSQTYTLAIALQGVQAITAVVSGYVPAGYYTRLRTVNNTGTPTYAYRAGQEVVM